MTRRISLALAIHNHQPVGNFGWVIADVFDRAYRPLVEALARHSGVRVALHYTGPLLEWLRTERPAFIADVRSLVERGQVEMIGGGWFEPILASIPRRDRLTQLARMADEVEATFGRRPRGAWLAERVWEPDVPGSLAATGYRWTILDDEHFRAASVGEEALWGAYTTDDEGSPLTLFGTERGLRYRIPFGTVEEVMGHLREHATEAGDRIGVMGDDGEKFGAWPSTFEHCWGEQGWVEAFLTALDENASWLATVTPSEWLDGVPPVGRVYVPTASYTEMGEWALPADEAREFRRVLDGDREAGRPEARWLRGGFWRNFQVRYREVNDLHKQMLRTSAKVAAMPPGADREQATDELGRGQSNDCYWHGLFGGIYIAHMRLATYAHLIAAEDLADTAAPAGIESPLVRDLDLDGRSEALLATDGQVVVVKPDEGAAVASWDIRAARHALLAVMRRRREAYHETLLDHEAAPAGTSTTTSDAETGDTAGPAERGSPSSIHEIVGAKEPGLVERLRFDAYERRSALIHVLGPSVDAEVFASGRFDERLDRPDGPFALVDVTPTRVLARRDASVRLDDGELVPVRLEQSVSIGGGRDDPTLETEASVTNVGDVAIDGRLAVEWNTMLLGGGGNPAAWWRIGDEQTEAPRAAHDAALSGRGVARVGQGNRDLALVIETSVTPAADAWISPIETISNSEAGFERVYQGSCLLLSTPMVLAPGATAGLRVQHAARVGGDGGRR